MVVLTLEMAVVFGVIVVAVVLFASEMFPPDITAIGILVTLALLVPVTGVGTVDAIAGFASPATITILAMYILSEGINQSGVVDRVGDGISRLTVGNPRRLLLATVGSTGISAGLMNNTPVVAVFIPMVTRLADRAGLSPSKLLLPLSYAAMLGGTLTLIGTATNLLASDLSRDLLDHPIGMFEFTPLGIVVLLVGIVYLLTLGHRLTPARVAPGRDLTAAYELENHLSRVRIREESAFVGRTVAELQSGIDEEEFPLDILRIERDGESHLARRSQLVVEPGDVLLVRSTLQSLNRLADIVGFRQLSRDEVNEADLIREFGTLVEAVVPPDSKFVGDAVTETELDTVLHTTVLAIRRGRTTIRREFAEVTLEAGDTLLLQTTDAAIDFLSDEGDLLVTGQPLSPLRAPAIGGEEPSALAPEAPYALGIFVGVIVLAALGLVPLVIAALGGVVAMVVTGCVTTADAYDAVSWNVIFLLAGVLPLGVAMQQTGGDAFIASWLATSAGVLPVLVILALVYLLTALLASVITPVASVVLMIPIAVDTASQIGADGFAFLLAATFAASGAFMTPIGYQTNLMVYGPGGFRFTDYVRVGAPLQGLLAVVVTLGIWVLYGV